MGFTLKLRFHGSVALVPSKDRKRVTMLIGKFNQPPDAKPLVPHIKFPKDSLQSTRTVESPPAGSKGDPNLRHIRLGEELLTLNAKVVGQPLTFNESDDPSPTPTRKNKLALRWLPHIAALEDDQIGTIDPALLALPPRAPLAGRIDLDRGLLQTTGILDPVLIDFEAPGRPTIRTAVAREAELVLEVDDDRIVIESDPLSAPRASSRDTTNDMVFTAKRARELVITIGNEPEDEIHHPIPVIRNDSDNDAEVREEFRSLYTMSAQRNAFDISKLRVPRVSGRRPSGNLCVIPVYNSGS